MRPQQITYRSLEHQRREVAYKLAMLHASPTECHCDWWFIAESERLNASLTVIETEMRRALRRNKGTPKRGFWQDWRKARRWGYGNF